MKARHTIPRILKLIQDNQLQDFTAGCLAKLYNDKYRNSVCSNQISQYLRRWPQFQSANFLINDVKLWSLKEGDY